MKKKLLFVISAVLMILSALSISAFAEGAVVDSGKCGENVTYTLYDNGELVISGTGEMYNSHPDAYDGSLADGFFEYNKNIVSVVIEDGVTSIGYYAFYGCSNLENVTIADSVLSIGAYAFASTAIEDNNTSDGMFYIDDCLIDAPYGDLSGYTVKDGTRVIAAQAFQRDDYIASVTLPESLEAIGDLAFSGCHELTSIHIPRNVKHIGYGAVVGGTKLETITVDENNEYFTVDEYGVLYSKDKTTLVSFPIGAKIETYTVPDSVTKIVAASNINLTYIEMSDSVTELGIGCFSGSEKLESVHLSDNIVAIPVAAFVTCSSLSSIRLPDNAEYIGVEAFLACTNLKAISIPDKVESIGDNAFYWCALKNVYIGKSVKTIGDGAFLLNSELKFVTIPENVVSIGEQAFGYYDGDREADLIPEFKIYGVYGTAAENYANTNGIAFATKAVAETGKCGENLTYTLYDNGELVISGTGEMYNSRILEMSASDGPFYNNENIVSVVIEDGVTSIGYYAFRGCSNLVKIIIPDSVLSIGDCAFEYTAIARRVFDFCTYINDCLIAVDDYSANEVAVKEGTRVIASRVCFRDCKIVSVTLPESLESISEYSFAGSEELTSLYIPRNVKHIGWGGACGGEKLEAITIDENNEYFTVDEYGVLYSKDKTTLVSFPMGAKIESYEVPDSVKKIDFVASYNLKSLAMTDSVTELHGYCFGNCPGLKSVVLSDNITVIPDYAFSYCVELTDVNIPENATSIGEQAFICCMNLKSIDISDSVKTIGDRAFLYNNELKSVRIPENVVSIGEQAFGYTGDEYTDNIIPIADFTIYGVYGTEAENYANRNGFAFAEMEFVDEPFTELENGDVKIEFEDGTVNDDVTLEVEEVEETEENADVFTLIREHYNKSNGQLLNTKVYDIKLMADGTSVQPNGKVLVRVPVPNGFKNDTLRVLHIKDDGTTEELPCYFEDGYVYFETDSFSKFAIVDLSEEEVKTDCDHLCHKDGFVGFIWKIIRFFWKIFKMNPVCECGMAHY